MKVFLPLIVLAAMVALVMGAAGAASLHVLFGVVIPYAALAVFVVGFGYRMLKWARVPVPFRITTTCGQQKSLPWIESAPLDCPSSTLGVVVRMALEILLFRSLFRNSTASIAEGERVIYRSNKLLWLAGLAFHWSFLIIVIRHFRFFIEPVPWPVGLVESLDGFFQIGLPILYATDILLVVSVTFLFLRRICVPQLRYISLAADYFPLFLVLGIAVTGVLMRYFTKVDVVGVKELAAGLLTLQPVVPEGISALFYLHLFLVCVLLAYFPFSKLMHMGGVFLSPTRNLPADSRARRHVNPWNYPVKVHPYDEYEDEFREKMIDAGIPVDKEA